MTKSTPLMPASAGDKHVARCYKKFYRVLVLDGDDILGAGFPGAAKAMVTCTLSENTWHISMTANALTKKMLTGISMGSKTPIPSPHKKTIFTFHFLASA